MYFDVTKIHVEKKKKTTQTPATKDIKRIENWKTSTATAAQQRKLFIRSKYYGQ